MVGLFSKTIKAAFEASDAVSTTKERGDILEDLVAYIFSQFQGVRLRESKSLNMMGSSEVDVWFWNDRLPASLSFLPENLWVECKNTSDKVGSSDVRIFWSKLHESRLAAGILIAANGITGNSDNLRAAHKVVLNALVRDNLRIIVLTRNELLKITSTDELIVLLQDKIGLLTLQMASFGA